MANDDPDARKLEELEAKLREARRSRPSNDRAQPGKNDQSKMGLAFRFVSELLAGVIVGGGIGWLLDTVLNTKPLLLIVMLLVGIAAGVLNVVRTAMEMNRNAGQD